MGKGEKIGRSYTERHSGAKELSEPHDMESVLGYKHLDQMV